MQKKEITINFFKPNLKKNNYLIFIVLLTIIPTFLCLFFVGNHSLTAHDELIYK